MGKFIVFKSVDEMPEMAVSSGRMNWNKTGSWRSTTPQHRSKTAPCNFNCPAGEDIRGYLQLMQQGDVAGAFELLTQANPLPSVCGRVCYHPCQAQCNRHGFDGAIEVRRMEMYIGDWALDLAPEEMPPPRGDHRVAIIGAGPAGLSAGYYLRHQGVQVTIFDENALPGGIMQYGIPDYRLDKYVLQTELHRVMQGVEFAANRRLGQDLQVADLLGYDAVFLATGAHISKNLRIPGEDTLGVETGLEFLKKINSGQREDLHDKEILVIGGGNTACDVARTAKRLGGGVSLVYRRTEAEMPAFAEEIAHLKEERIACTYLSSPVGIAPADAGRVQCTFIRMRLGEPDASGRARPEPIPGSEFEVIADKVYIAIGEDPDLTFFPEVEQAGDGGFDFSRVDPRLKDRLYVGGDLLPNPRTVSHAVGSGRLAAEKIGAFLRGETLTPDERVTEVVGPEDINFGYFTRINLVKWQTRLLEQGRFNTRDAAIAEANRCLSCGVCNECDNCFNFCPDMAVIKTAEGYQVNLDYCKGCGLCAAECPRGPLHMEGDTPA